jgi:hypothetical protein
MISNRLEYIHTMTMIQLVSTTGAKGAKRRARTIRNAAPDGRCEVPIRPFSAAVLDVSSSPTGLPAPAINTWHVTRLNPARQTPRERIEPNLRHVWASSPSRTCMLAREQAEQSAARRSGSIAPIAPIARLSQLVAFESAGWTPP